jgi:hypothetical protein
MIVRYAVANTPYVSFQKSNTSPIFVKAASDMLAALPTKSEHKITKPRRNVSYGELKKFQEYSNSGGYEVHLQS